MKASLKDMDGKGPNSFLFNHIKTKTLNQRWTKKKTIDFTQNLIKVLDRTSKELKERLGKRKGRTCIDPRWEKWIRDNKKFMQKKSNSKIIKRMKKV